jgi:hypothetical protein
LNQASSINNDAKEQYTGARNSKGQKHGHGKLILADGAIYDGDWIDDKRTGKGKYTWANGDFYEGDFKDDKQTGKGKFTSTIGAIYEGDVVDSKQYGKGKYIWPNGDFYDGDWIDDKQTGKGKFRWNDGTIYDGEWKDGERDGKGTFFDSKGNATEEKREKGKLITGNGTLVFSEHLYYKGEIKEGKPDGKGCMFQYGKLSFDCEWKNGKKEGEGIHYSHGDIIFSGIFKNDLYYKGKEYDGERVNEGEFGELEDEICLKNGSVKYTSEDCEYDIEVRNFKFGKGKYVYLFDGSSFEGEFDGKSSGSPNAYSGRSEGFLGHIFGDIKCNKVDGWAKKVYPDDIHEVYKIEFERYGYVKSIEGNFNGKNGWFNPIGSCRVIFENGKEFDGEGDGQGGLTIHT